MLGGRYNLTDHYFVNGSVIFDLSRQNQDAVLMSKSSKFSIGSIVAGGGYTDECTDFSINYISGYTYGVGTESTGQAVLAQLTFKTLGTAKASQSLGGSTVTDGITTGH